MEANQFKWIVVLIAVAVAPAGVRGFAQQQAGSSESHEER